MMPVSLHTTTEPIGFVLGVNWGDLGIGAAAMLGLVLLATGLAAGAHYRSVRALKTNAKEEP